MKNEDLEFLAGIVEKSRWLFYGDLDEHFDGFLRDVFRNELRDYGFETVPMTRDFAVAYWLFISEMVALDLVEYGTSPRGCWLTTEGGRVKTLGVSNEEAISEARE